MSDVKLKPGRVSMFPDSMAEAMDKAFREEWKTVKHTTVSSLGEEDRKILLVAIAQGVVAHLQKQIEAVLVEVDVTDHHGDGSAVDIKVEGLMEVLKP